MVHRVWLRVWLKVRICFHFEFGGGLDVEDHFDYHHGWMQLKDWLVQKGKMRVEQLVRLRKGFEKSTLDSSLKCTSQDSKIFLVRGL